MTTSPEQIQTKTEFGLPIDYSFAKAASEESLQQAASALRLHNFTAEIVDTPAAAREYVNSILPTDQTILTSASDTVVQSGLDEDINRSGKYMSVRTQLEKLDYKTQRAEMRKLGAAPDVEVGSVAAVTEDGRLVVASASGSQIGPFASTAGKLILVVGSQKIVPDMETAMKRLQLYAYPKEDIRTRAKYGMPTAILKVLTINGDWPGRTTIVLIRESIGY